MESQARAGIDIFGRVMRYAEVEQYGARYRLLRLGSCDFEFDVADELFGAENPVHMGTIADAIRDVFHGSVADELRLAVHPPRSITFLSVTPKGATDASDAERFALEASLLDDSAPDDLYVSEERADQERLDVGDAGNERHVMALPKKIHASFLRIVRDLPISTASPMSSMCGVARALHCLARKHSLSAPGKPLVLAIGLYPTHLEFTVSSNGRWHFSHHTVPGNSADAVYFALALFRQLSFRPEDVGKIVVYGLVSEMAELDSMEVVFGVRAEKLDTIPIVDLDVNSLSSGFDFEAYAPCIGISL